MGVQCIKLAHEFEVGGRETAAKFGIQAFSQALEHLRAVYRPALALLFKLNNVPTNLKIGVHLHQINATGNRVASGLNQCADVGKQRPVDTQWGGHRAFCYLFSSCLRLPYKR